MVVCDEITRFIKKVGLQVERTPKEVYRKIQNLEKSYREAADWLSYTDQGVENKRDIKEAKTKRCIYYDILYPIMSESNTVTPLYTEQELEDTSDANSTDTNDNNDFPTTNGLLPSPTVLVTPTKDPIPIYQGTLTDNINDKISAFTSNASPTLHS